MTGGRRFSLSSPDWGQDHLSLDAIVAYVDDELGAGAHARAAAHLAGCAECRAEVVSQFQARAALRTAAGPCLPSSLLRSLRSIPVEAELPPPPPGLGITTDGQFVLLRDVPHAGESPAHPGGPPRTDAGRAAGRRLSRRARVGAVSGLAIGALAVGAFAAPGVATPPAPGVLGGPALTVPAPARLSPAEAVPALSPAVVGRPAPAIANPAVLDTRTGEPTAGEATDAVDATSGSTTTPDDSAGVLDARLRARLERSPVAFYRSP